uniref:Uncharacterized protein n=1 Tax=Anguilla anguilla TaxID=7936 RepID=A0A0E9S400_ANGAN
MILTSKHQIRFLKKHYKIN